MKDKELTNEKTLTRRSLLQRSGLAGIGLLAANALPRPARAKAPADPDPAPGAPSALAPLPADPAVYPFRIGAMEAFVIQDGLFMFPGKVQPTIAPEGKPDEVKKLLYDNFLPDRITVSLNVLALKVGGEVILVDTGAGGAFGPTAGRLLRGLETINVKPEQVTTVIITHAHGDHIAGLLTAEGKPTFAKAKTLISQTEADFWLGANPDFSKSKIPADTQKQFVGAAKQILGAVTLTKVAPGPILPGIVLSLTPGHTPGHASLEITDGGESLLVIADAVHAYALQFPRPEWTMAFDTVPADAVASRKTLFARAAKERLKVHTYHLPFPGVGHVRAVGSGYEWVPQPWAV